MMTPTEKIILYSVLMRGIALTYRILLQSIKKVTSLEPQETLLMFTWKPWKKMRKIQCQLFQVHALEFKDCFYIGILFCCAELIKAKFLKALS